MSGLCACNVGISNLGRPGCVPVPKVLKKFIVVNLFADDGTENKIDPAGTLNKAAMVALINQSDKSKRFYISPEIKNITTEKEDPVYETFEDGSKFFVREGVRTFNGMLPVAPPSFKSKVESVRCNTSGVYLVDIEGNLIGIRKYDSDEYLYPIPINIQSVNAKFNFGTDSTTSGLAISYDFPTTLNDSDIRMIVADAFTDYSLVNDIDSLIDAHTTISGISATGFTATIVTEYGSLHSKLPVKGLVAADFTLYNITDSSNITITSVTETSDGVYVFVIPSQTASDDLRLTPEKDGLEFSTVATIEVPA